MIARAEMSTNAQSPQAEKSASKGMSVALIGPNDAHRQIVARALASSQGRKVHEFIDYPDNLNDLPGMVEQNFDCRAGRRGHRRELCAADHREAGRDRAVGDGVFRAHRPGIADELHARRRSRLSSAADRECAGREPPGTEPSCAAGRFARRQASCCGCAARRCTAG